MKALKDLSKDELISFIYHLHPGTINIFDPLASCSICGKSGAMYDYVCDSCNKKAVDHDD